jgi:predicted AlkP superfamily phosphohydrolase/phosphomutase
VPYEVPGLTSAFSGRLPAEHGWFSYWAAQGHGYQPRVLSQADQRLPYLWQRRELADRKFAVINVFGTHPPVPLDGWVISYPMDQTVRASHPKSLLWELSQKGISYAHDVSIWYAGQERHEFVSRALAADRERGAAARELWGRGPDVLIVNLTGIDRVCHFYWQELEPGSPFPEEETAIYRAFLGCDHILSSLLELVDESTTLISFSEIGFGPLRAYVSINDLLTKAGFQKKGLGPEGPVPQWAETSAFEAVQGTHGININLRGRQETGPVAEGDYERVRAEVAVALREAVNPYTGCRMFRTVRPREEVYPGPALEAAPDLVLEPLDERYQPLGDRFWASRVNRTLQSGWHRRQSYAAVAGGDVAGGRELAEAAPVDIAATVCAALGVEVPSDFDGKVLG